MDETDLLAALGAQLEASTIIEAFLREIGDGNADKNATAIVARLARHEPPILLAYPHELKN